MKLSRLVVAASALVWLTACQQPAQTASETSKTVTQTTTTSTSSSATSPVTAASFDCAHALPGTEATICGDPQLVQLDQELDRLYKLVDSHLADSERVALKRLQDGWQTQRDACSATVDAKSCLQQAYAMRISDLRTNYDVAGNDKAGISLGPVRWRCPGTTQLLSSTFINARTGLVFLKRDTVSVVLPQAVSADGGRYTAALPDGNYEFWTKGRETRFTVPGQAAVTCTEADANAQTSAAG